MAAKTNKKKVPAPLAPGFKPSTRKIDPVLRKMIHEDRAIASGGRNIVQRKAAARWPNVYLSPLSVPGFYFGDILQPVARLGYLARYCK